MAGKVYANGREVSSKSAGGKAVAAFPDVCFTPPTTPATPPGVPVPYPNTGMASDTAGGSKTVKIGGKEVMLKNQSYFKKSMGDEAGAAPKKGVMTSVNRGKVYFTSWSMDVKFEGKNVVRHLDMTTHNHASMPGNTPPWAYVDTQAVTPIKDCKKEVKAVEEKCKGLTTTKAQCANKACREAKKCLLVTYKQGKRTGKKSNVACCPGEQPHHLVEAHCFYEAGQRGSVLAAPTPKGKAPYVDKDAPCVCASGPRHAKKHGQYHAFQGGMERAYNAAKRGWNYGEARTTGVKAHSAVNPQCSEECTKAQLDAYHKQKCGFKDSSKVRIDPVKRSEGHLNPRQRALLKAAKRGPAGLGGGY